MSFRDSMGLIISTLLVILAMLYSLSSRFRTMMRVRSRKNLGSAAGLDAAVIGIALGCLGGIAGVCAKLFAMDSLAARLLNVVLLVGLFGSLVFCVIMVAAYLYGRPSWVIRDPEDFWIRDFRKEEAARRKSKKSEDR
jgi:phage shock protein PspC (stress-responsive transcriptional regulator)